MKNLICGYGNIGKHTLDEFKAIAHEFEIYDKYNSNYNSSEILNNVYDYAFVCVPTEKNEDGSCNIREVYDIVAKINASIIVIKSAIPVGTTEDLQHMYNKNIVVSPEYYGTTQHSSDSPNFLVLGGDRKHCSKVVQLFSRVKKGDFRYIFVDHRTAELAKYMENCWLATKVTFCNEFAKIANAYDINYEELRECFIVDDRVNPSHTYVYPDKPYYDSHCLNKDIPALINFAKRKGVKTPLMNSVDTINQLNKLKNQSNN